MSFGNGVNLFYAGNKAGSIELFTKYLESNPDDYDALKWRAEALGSINQPESAFSDLVRATSLSDGVKREIVSAQRSFLTNGLDEYGTHVERTLAKYPDQWQAYMEYGKYNSMIGDGETACCYYKRSLDLALSNGIDNPEICHANYELGKHMYEIGDVAAAENYLKKAIQSCPAHVDFQMLLSNCNSFKDHFPAARKYFQMAKERNPGLSSELFGTENFDTYYNNFRKYCGRHNASTFSLDDSDVSAMNGLSLGKKLVHHCPGSGKHVRTKDKLESFLKPLQESKQPKIVSCNEPQNGCISKDVPERHHNDSSTQSLKNLDSSLSNFGQDTAGDKLNTYNCKVGQHGEGSFQNGSSPISQLQRKIAFVSLMDRLTPDCEQIGQVIDCRQEAEKGLGRYIIEKCSNLTNNSNSEFPNPGGRHVSQGIADTEMGESGTTMFCNLLVCILLLFGLIFVFVMFRRRQRHRD